jgi:hypothetical protein
MADWVTSISNPMFSKVIANRLWKHALGYGLVEPVDNWTDRSNIAHEEALDVLVQVLLSSEFDVRETLRTIYHTKLFQRESCDFEITDGRIHDFRGPLLRRMSAEEIYDSLITLEKGNVDGVTNQGQVQKWERFQESIQELKQASPQEITHLDDEADRVEDAVKAPMAEVRALQIQRSKLLKEGKDAEAQRISLAIKRIYKKIQEIKREAASGEQMSASMVMRNNIKVHDRGLLRASEMAQPFKPGSFARDFGASDRRTTNAQHTNASIPQALTMLNGYQIERITSRTGGLATTLKQNHRENDRLDTLFLSIYNRYPTSKEYSQYKTLSRTQQDIHILAKAMLNSKNFLFVQ